MAWSGDVFQAQVSGNSNLKFVVPEEGGMFWHDNCMIPYHAAHPVDAIEWIDYSYRPEVQAKITDWVNYVSPVPDAKPIIAGQLDDPTVANSPLVFPDAATTEQASSPTTTSRASTTTTSGPRSSTRSSSRELRVPTWALQSRERALALVPYLLSLPTALWLGVFFVLPLRGDPRRLADDRQLDRRAGTLTWNFSIFGDAISDLLDPVRPLVPLRRALDR